MQGELQQTLPFGCGKNKKIINSRSRSSSRSRSRSHSVARRRFERSSNGSQDGHQKTRSSRQGFWYRARSSSFVSGRSGSENGSLTTAPSKKSTSSYRRTQRGDALYGDGSRTNSFRNDDVHNRSRVVNDDSETFRRRRRSRSRRRGRDYENEQSRSPFVRNRTNRRNGDAHKTRSFSRDWDVGSSRRNLDGGQRSYHFDNKRRRRRSFDDYSSDDDRLPCGSSKVVAIRDLPATLTESQVEEIIRNVAIAAGFSPPNSVVLLSSSQPPTILSQTFGSTQTLPIFVDDLQSIPGQSLSDTNPAISHTTPTKQHISGVAMDDVASRPFTLVAYADFPSVVAAHTFIKSSPAGIKVGSKYCRVSFASPRHAAAVMPEALSLDWRCTHCECLNEGNSSVCIQCHATRQISHDNNNLQILHRNQQLFHGKDPISAVSGAGVVEADVAVDIDRKRLPLPPLDRFIYDERCKYYYHAESGLFYDSASAYYMTGDGDYYLREPSGKSLIRMFKMVPRDKDGISNADTTANKDRQPLVASHDKLDKKCSLKWQKDSKLEGKAKAEAVADILASAKEAAKATKNAAKIMPTVLQRDVTELIDIDNVTAVSSSISNTIDVVPPSLNNDVSQHDHKESSPGESSTSKLINTSSTTQPHNWLIRRQPDNIPQPSSVRDLFTDDTIGFVNSNSSDESTSAIIQKSMADYSPDTNRIDQICYICCRKLLSENALATHYLHSDLHQRNLISQRIRFPTSSNDSEESPTSTTPISRVGSGIVAANTNPSNTGASVNNTIRGYYNSSPLVIK